LNNIACDWLDKIRVSVDFTCIKTDLNSHISSQKRTQSKHSWEKCIRQQSQKIDEDKAASQFKCCHRWHTEVLRLFCKVIEDQCEELSERSTTDIIIKSSIRNSSLMMLMLKNAESLTTEFDWVQLIDTKLDTSEKFKTTSEMNVEINNLKSFESCAAELICASDLLESKSVKSENSETTLTSDLTINKSESVESLQSKFDWTFEIIYDRLEDSSHFRFLEKDEWHNALHLCHSSHFLLWTCNSLIVLHQRMSWNDSDLHESNAFYFQKLKNVYFIFWVTISFVFTRLYYQEWNQLSTFFSHDLRFLSDYDEHDRCVHQLIMNIERRLVFNDHVHVLLMIYFDRR